MSACATTASADASLEQRDSIAAVCDPRWQISSAARSDHAAVFHLLSAARGPHWDDFRVLVDEPGYAPDQRLLARCGRETAGHVQVVPRTMQVGLSTLPVAVVRSLAVLPEHRGRGLGRRLLQAAEAAASRGGAAVCLAWTRDPELFCRHGWAVCGPRLFSEAGAREILAALVARGLHPRAARRLSIRPCRRMEITALARIYDQNLAAAFGPFRRSQAYWGWLVERHGYDRLYVAVLGPKRAEIENPRAIVGYAALRGRSVVELLTDAEHHAAAVDLLIRACGDAIENDHHVISLHAAPDHRLHRLLNLASNREDLEPERGEVLVAKLLCPLRLLRLLDAELRDRARRASAALPLELGLEVERSCYRLSVGADHARVVARQTGADWVSLGEAEFCRLLLGYLNWEAATSTCRVRGSNPAALVAAQSLFPRLPAWHPTLDDLPSPG